MEPHGQKEMNDLCSVMSRGNALYELWAEKNGISYNMLSVVYALRLESGITQRSIAMRYGIPKQTVNTAVRELKQKGYVVLEPSKEDKRERLVVLTEAGRNYAQELLEPLKQIEDKVYRIIGAERFSEAVETLELFALAFAREIKDR